MTVIFGKLLIIWCEWNLVSAQSVTYQVEPDSPAVYIAQPNRPMSLSAQKTPLRDTMARKPPPEPRIAIVGTWESKQWRLEYIGLSILP